jgi:hypothetical protein
MAKATSLDHFLNLNIIKTMNQSTGQRNKREKWYVVTRNGRRAWPKDYWTIDEAQHHDQGLIASLKSFNDSNYKNVVIMETDDPSSIN